MLSRIKELRKVKAKDLLSNPKNLRSHPPSQVAAMEAALEEIGSIAPVLARELPDGRLELIDGHLRKDMDPDAELDVIVTDLDEHEADKALLTFDATTAMAQFDPARTAALAERVKLKSAELRNLVRAIPSVKPLRPVRPRQAAAAADPADESARAYGGATAMTRGSGPFKLWRELGLLEGTVLDVGAGHDEHEFAKYDPFHHPDPTPLAEAWDVVTCNYVLNVQPAEHLITQLVALLARIVKRDGKVLIAVRADVDETAAGVRGTQVSKTVGEWGALLEPFFVYVTPQAKGSSGFHAFVCTPKPQALNVKLEAQA